MYTKLASTSTILASALTLSLMLSACGSSSGDSSSATTPLTSGQLVDNYVKNVDYLCADGSTGVTDIDGRFNCDLLPVSFKLGELKLGEIATIPADKQIFPHDLLGVDRNETNNSAVIAMATFLQSCDDDNNTVNGIEITDSVKSTLPAEDFDENSIDTYATEADVVLISEDDAIAHIENSLDLTNAIDEVSLPQTVKDALLSSNNILSQDVLNTLAFMGNEERLAYDVYNKLYEVFPELKQLENIPTKSEYKHIQTVQLLVKKYINDLNEFTNTNTDTNTALGLDISYADIPIESMPAGNYNIDELQTLYSDLIAKGTASEQDALEVGCLVEVTDINDLLLDIQTAQESNASDIVTAFEFLRDGSYSHYWSFNNALINMGVTEGCCTLGDVYCHPEYPQPTTGGDGVGERHRYGQQ